MADETEGLAMSIKGERKLIIGDSERGVKSASKGEVIVGKKEKKKA